MARTSLIALILALVVCVACGSATVEKTSPPAPSPSPTPTEDPRDRVASKESESQDPYQHTDFNPNRRSAREAAAQFIKTNLPKWILKGIASQSYESNVFWVDVDIANGSRTAILSLMVKQFFPESGEPYWKAFPIDSHHASQLHYAHDAEVQRQLDEASDKVQRYENGEKP